MASAIDATKPVQGNPTTASVRDNFAAAKSEIEALQLTAGVGPQGPIGNTGPSGTLSVGTVTTGAAGSNATVTNTGTTQAAVLNFTIPRGDAGTGGSGITETQAKDAVRQGNVRFEESSATEAVTFPTTPNLAQPPVVGEGWSPATGGTATQAYTHDVGSNNPLAYPATISTGTFYQIVFGLTNVAATSTTNGPFVSNIYFRTAPTTTTGQQTVSTSISNGQTITIKATGNFTHVVINPDSNWQGNFTMTRVVAFTGAKNSPTFSIKDLILKARTSSVYLGSGGELGTSTSNISIGSGAMEGVTSGSSNIAMGSNALFRCTSASTNIAMGPSALLYLTSGSHNIGLGSTALQHITTGSYNIGLGQYACYSYRGPTSSYNIAIGYYTQYWGFPSPASNENIAMGSWTGFRGSHNVGIGYCALAYASGPPGEFIGSNNVGVGRQAGSHLGSGSHTAGDNSVYLGANTKAGADAATNEIVIGYNAEGHGSHTITLGNSNITALHCNVQTILALSDSRVKENIQATNLDKCLNAVKNLPVSEWDWLPIAGAHRNKHDIGFVSDDVAKVFPQAITKEDRFLTVRDAQGNPEMTTVTEPVWTPPDQQPDAAAPRTQTRQVEKTTEIKGLQYVSTAEMLPTLWGAVQRLTQQVEELRAQLAGGTPETPQPQPEPAPGVQPPTPAPAPQPTPQPLRPPQPPPPQPPPPPPPPRPSAQPQPPRPPVPPQPPQAPQPPQPPPPPKK